MHQKFSRKHPNQRDSRFKTRQRWWRLAPVECSKVYTAGHRSTRRPRRIQTKKVKPERQKRGCQFFGVQVTHSRSQKCIVSMSKMYTSVFESIYIKIFDIQDVRCKSALKAFSLQTTTLHIFTLNSYAGALASHERHGIGFVHHSLSCRTEWCSAGLWTGNSLCLLGWDQAPQVDLKILQLKNGWKLKNLWMEVWFFSLMYRRWIGGF